MRIETGLVDTAGRLVFCSPIEKADPELVGHAFHNLGQSRDEADLAGRVGG